MSTTSFPLLQTINDPADLRRLARADLKQLATELRAFVIESVSQTGGHLSSNLGTVELTVALHHVFNTPEDRLVWDVGHQTYPHKILTGRRDRMHTLRQLGGISGFPQRAESVYDTFGTAHSSTSISAALGMALAAAKLSPRAWLSRPAYALTNFLRGIPEYLVLLVIYFGGTVYWVVEVMQVHGGLHPIASVLVGALLISYLAIYPAVLSASGCKAAKKRFSFFWGFRRLGSVCICCSVTVRPLRQRFMQPVY